MMSCYIGMLLFIAIEVYSECSGVNGKAKFFLKCSGLILITVHYFFMPDHFMTISVIRFILFTIGLHLLIAFIPFIKSGELNAFWQYNKIIFLRILTSALYSAVLYIGLALAILAINELFKTDIDGKVYGDLWIFIVGVFNTWFFLSGFPAKFEFLESRTDYPKGLKIFTQYVLLPLITVYLLILYAYMFKIIFTMQWPVGWVSYLVLGFSIAGILSLLLIHPIRNNQENQWMLVFSRFFYFAIFPLLIMLFFAIKRRISDYGVTENRYFVLVLAVWLVFIASYFLVSKTKNIKLIPLTLCIVAFLTSFGPWGAFHVSLKSQEKHLTNLLEKNKIIVSGKIIKTDAAISYDDNREIRSVVEYIVEVHGYRTMQPYFIHDLDSLMKSDSTIFKNRRTYDEANKILTLMNLKEDWIKAREETTIDFNSGNKDATFIIGYDYFISDFRTNKSNVGDSACSTYLLGISPIEICFYSELNELVITNRTDSALRFDVSSLVKELRKKNYTNDSTFKPGDLTMNSVAGEFAAKIIFSSIYGDLNHDTIKLTRLNADIMIKQKKENVNEVGERNQ